MKAITTIEELADWANYKKCLKLQLKQLDEGEADFFVSKEKVDFEINGRPWRGHALLAGAKGKQSSQALRKLGVVFREGRCRAEGETLVTTGLPKKLVREAAKCVSKMQLGYDLPAPVGEDEDEAEESASEASDSARASRARTASTSAAPSEAPSGGTERAAEWKSVWDRLLPIVKKTLATNPAAAGVIKPLLEEINGHTKARRFGDALATAKKLSTQLQSLASQGAAAPGGGKRTPPTTMDFSDEEGLHVEVPVSRGDPGLAAEQQIATALSDFANAIQNYWSNYALGLQSFTTRMTLSSEQEAAPKYLEAVFKGIAKEALSTALSKIGEKAGGPWGEVISFVKAGVEAWVEESERVAAAGGQVKIADYVESVANSIGVQRDRMSNAVPGFRRTILEHYRRLSENEVGGGRANADGIVIGEPARLLNELTRGVVAFAGAIPKPSWFQHRLATRFADTPGLTTNVARGGRPSGTLYFDVNVLVEPGDTNTWSVQSKSDAWVLVTAAPSPERVAANLANSLEGSKLWQVDLPKMVRLRVEIEEFGLNTIQNGAIYFTRSPDSFEVRSNYSDTWFKAAWAVPAIRNAALNNAKLEGSND